MLERLFWGTRFTLTLEASSSGVLCVSGHVCGAYLCHLWMSVHQFVSVHLLVSVYICVCLFAPCVSMYLCVFLCTCVFLYICMFVLLCEYISMCVCVHSAAPILISQSEDGNRKMEP